MSREAAQRLMKALVDRGHEVGVPVQNAQIQVVATNAGIDGDEQDAAITEAFGAGWLVRGPRPELTNITQSGWDTGNA